VVWNQCLFFAVRIPLDWTYCVLQKKMCNSHRPFMSCFILYVCCYWEPCHVLSIQMWTPLEWMWTNRGRNGIKTSLLVDSRIMLHYFIMDPLLPLPALRMQNVRYSRLCRSGSTTGFCPFSLFLPPPPTHPPTRPLLLRTDFVQLQPFGLSNWSSSFVG